MALATSAAVSVAVLGGAVAVAALSGNGLLGFSSGPSDAGSPGAGGTPVGAGAESEAPTGADASNAPRVTIEVIEDRVVVRSLTNGGTANGAGVLVRAGSVIGVGDPVSSPASGLGASPANGGSETSLPRSGRDDYDNDHDDEYDDESDDDDHHDVDHDDDDDDHDEDHHEYEHEDD